MKIPKPKLEPTTEASKMILVLAGAVIVVAGLKLADDFFIPILLAFFFATISFPITNWLREHGVPRFFAVCITVIVDFAFIAGVVFLGIILVSDISAKWDSKYYQKTNERLTQLTDWTAEFYKTWAPQTNVKEEEVEVLPVDKVEEEDKQSGFITSEELAQAASEAAAEENAAEENAVISEIAGEDTAEDAAVVVEPIEVKPIADFETGEIAARGITQFKEQFLQTISKERIWNSAKDIFDQLLSFLKTVFVVLLITVFMLSEARMFGRRISVIFDAQGPNLQRMLSAIKDIQKYLGIKTIISMATGLLAGILCWQVGLEFPLLWGILAFVLNFIPAVGSIIAGIPPVLLSLLDNGSFPEAAVIGGGYILINGVLGNFIEPSLLGRRFGISTVVVILSVVFWGWLWGPVGMLMAVPLTMLLKVALDNSSDLQWIAVAISKESKTAKKQEEISIKETIESKATKIVDDVVV